MQVGSVLLDGAALLAPMSGITDAGFRRIALRFGASLAVSEMVAADGLVAGAAEAALRAEGRGLTLHAVQLAGCQERWMSEAARIAEASGACLIDINMGCPAKRVTGGDAGSALMRDLAHAQRLIKATVAAVRVPVTVKMRLGWDEASVNAPELARRAEAEGVAMITVHGRTRCQFYKDRADWRAIRAVCDAVDIPIVANGDCTSLADARAMLAASGAHAVMIGRAALGRPWFVGQVAAGLAGRPVPRPSRSARLGAVLEHYEDLLHAFGVQVGVRHARKHLAGAMDHLANEGVAIAPAMRRAVLGADDPGSVRRLMAELFSLEQADAAA